MNHNKTNKKVLYTGLVVLSIIFVAGVIWTKGQPEEEEYAFPPPDAVVRQYFTAWNNKDYANMYATFSDGFKKIEPTATGLQAFKGYVGSQNIESVKVISIREKGNDGQTSSVDYDIEFLLGSGQKLPYQGTFTLKYRSGDVIRGWKLIHPYGENIDTR